MPGTQVADVWARLVLDDKNFKKDIDTSAGEAGDKAGKTLGQRIKSGTQRDEDRGGSGRGVRGGGACRNTDGDRRRQGV